MTFEWDARKGAANFTKHGRAFEDAVTVFLDPLATTFPDPDHSKTNAGKSPSAIQMKGHLVFVSHCERRRRIQIISARRATRTEREQYEEGING